jgi:hypothetical protein
MTREMMVHLLEGKLQSNERKYSNLDELNKNNREKEDRYIRE